MSLETTTQPVTRCLATVCVLMTCALADSLAGSDVPTPTVLEFHSGDFVRGKLLGIEDNKLEWDGEFFSQPFTFPLDRVAGIKRAPEPDFAGEGEFVIELMNRRDMLFGDLLAIDEDTMELRSKWLGQLKLRRDVVRRLTRNGEDSRLYPVPARLNDWTKSSDDHWGSEGNIISSHTTGASLYADVNLPSKAMIEVELSWKGVRPLNPGFGMHFGTNQQQQSLETAFSIEVWQDQLVAQRRHSKLADVAALGSTAPGSCHFIVYMDQISGQMMVYDTSGELLGQIKVPPANRAAPILSGITLVNRKGNVQLNQLHIRGWSGLNPSPSAQAGKISVVLNGEVHAANDLRVSNGKVALLGGDGVRRLDLDDVIVISFPSESLNEEHQITVTWQDGTRISGDLLSATKNEFVIRSYLASEPIHLPLTGLRSLWFGKKKVDSKMAPADRRAGTLELMDTRMKGWLVEGIRENEPTGSCLVWQAAEALAPSPLKKDVYGRILYVEPPAPVRISRPNNSARQRQLLAAARLRPNRRPKPVKARNEKLAGTAVHLRSGDAIPCKVTSIDKRGVHIESDLTESRSIPHNQVKAAQLTRTVAMPLLAKNKRQRLLTLPRMQRDIPPQHLLFSTKGDVLRGSILSMGELDLDLELRLDAHRIPRDRVSAIVWLHEDEVSEDGEGETDQGDDLAVGGNEADIDKMQVQVIGSTGSRFSFFAGSFSDQTIHGYSDVLKNVHASLGEIDQLLIGGFIHRAARTLPYHRWRLTAARDPKFVTEGDETGRETIAGTESNLVNEPAPPIRLKMLEGDKDFQLSDHLGHCVVLDFWASWCGPCLQVMPQVEQVVSEFAEKDVRVFAINLEETAEQVQATLERRQIHLPVALDRDGVAAARYEATAIPQTVVIGPDGNVARVFVGSSRHFAEQLRAALVELTQTEEHE